MSSTFRQLHATLRGRGKLKFELRTSDGILENLKIALLSQSGWVKALAFRRRLLVGFRPFMLI